MVVRLGQRFFFLMRKLEEKQVNATSTVLKRATQGAENRVPAMQAE